jgi:HD superfamily phosphohydrolase YqeK
MNLTPEQIQDNWNELLSYIEDYIEQPRKDKLLEFYEQYADRLMLMPAAHKKEYHNAFPGGYVEHVLRVIRCAIKQAELWNDEGCDMSTFTIEELVFSALNHDLGKMGSEDEESYIPQTDNWRREKLGEDYMFNTKVPFASVPDRGLFMLQSHGISYTFNEMIAIQTHDGLYDKANEKYLMSYMPEQKPRTSLPFILHQADLMAARIEFEREWLPKLKENKKPVDAGKGNYTLGNKPNMSKKTSTKTKALGSFKSDSLKNMLDSL